MHLKKKVNVSVPTAKGKPCRGKAASKLKTRATLSKKQCFRSPTPGSRPHLLHLRCSCHAKDCACTDIVETGTPHAGCQEMPSPRATWNCTLQPYRIWAEQRMTLSPEDRERKGGWGEGHPTWSGSEDIWKLVSHPPFLLTRGIFQ